MTRKDYVRLAAAIATIEDSGTRRTVAELIARVLQGDNPRFDYDRFYVACKVGEDNA